MSTIAAGTTSGTALVSTGNTDGTLQLQVNGTTPSITLAANGSIGVGSTPGYGTNGQVLTSAGTGAAPTWSTLTVSGSGGSTASGSVTLTSASSGAQSITTTAYGQTVTLPDATTMSKAAAVFMIRNAGDFPLRIVNTSGSLLGFVNPQQGANIGLADNSTAAGVWVCDNLLPVAVTAHKTFTGLSATSSGIIRSVAIDTTRTLIVWSPTSGAYSVYGVVYDASSQTYGTPTVLGTSIAQAAVILSAANQVLMFAVDTSANTYFKTLTLIGTAITVNATTTKAVANTFSGFLNDADNPWTQVGSTFVIRYVQNTDGAVLLAATVSGTTVTVGNEVVISSSGGGTGTGWVYTAAVSASVLLVVSMTTGVAYYAMPYSVAGVTLTQGTRTSSGLAGSSFRILPISSGARWALVYTNASSSISCAIISVAGTTASDSTVILFSDYLSIGTVANLDMIVSGSKLMAIQSNASQQFTCNMVTDTAGTASAGTAILPFSTATFAGYENVMGAAFTSGNTVVFTFYNGSSSYKVNCDFSGSSLTVTDLISWPTGGSVTTTVDTKSQAFGTLRSGNIKGNGYYYALSPNQAVQSTAISTNFIRTFLSNLLCSQGTLATSTSTSQRWSVQIAITGATSIIVTSYECATA